MRGRQGVGDGSDKLVTVDVNPKFATYGKVVDFVSVKGRGEARHMGFTDDRKYLWTGRLDDNKIFVFDVGTDPARPMPTDVCARSTLLLPDVLFNAIQTLVLEHQPRPVTVSISQYAFSPHCLNVQPNKAE